jgi:DNA-binding Lrp family transcriptional regulator
MQLTKFDKQLLNIIQTGLPLTQTPFSDIAEQLGSDENTVIERLAELRTRGVIRRIGAFFDAESLGYKGLLVAVRVAPEALPEVALAVNAWPQVTHNDERENEYNLWFTLQSRDEKTMIVLLDAVAEMPGVEEVISMPTSDRYKVNVEFQME